MYSNRGWSYSSPAPARSRVLVQPAYRRRGFAPPRFSMTLPRIRWDLLLAAGPLPLAVIAVAGVAWYQVVFAGFVLGGRVVDSASGQPIAGARVASAAATATTDSDGAFQLPGFKPLEMIAFDAPGYLPVTLRPFRPDEPLAGTLDPVSLRVRVKDAETGQPILDATALAGSRPAQVLPDGELQLSPVLANQQFRVEAAGYLPIDLAYGGEAEREVLLQPKLDGRVTDARTGQGVPRVRLSTPTGVLMTDSAGAYQLSARPTGGQITALMPGYRRATLDLNGAPGQGLNLQLQPNVVKGLYMTYYSIGNTELRQRMFELLDTTEANAVVIDVKGDPSYLAYQSRVPLAQAIGANDQPTITDLDGLLADLRRRNVYVIARIVVFKDNLLARNGSKVGADVAIKNSRTGEPWVDGEDLAWVDPFQQRAWDYNIALGQEAIERGFDEVQFDYIRFPTDPSKGSSVGEAVYSQPVTGASQVNALKTFLGRAREAINGAGGFLGIDTFGYTTWWDDGGGIGQDLVALAESVDYISPMIYPSTFTAGLPGSINYPAVVRQPYEVVFQSVQKAQAKVAGQRAVVRPWLQYYDDYDYAQGVVRYRYDAPQIEAQKQATADAKGVGWMLWDATTEFRRGGLVASR